MTTHQEFLVVMPEDSWTNHCQNCLRNPMKISLEKSLKESLEEFSEFLGGVHEEILKETPERFTGSILG